MVRETKYKGGEKIMTAEAIEIVPVVNAVLGTAGEALVDSKTDVCAVITGQGTRACNRPSAVDPSERVQVITPTAGLQTD